MDKIFSLRLLSISLSGQLATVVRPMSWGQNLCWAGGWSKALLYGRICACVVIALVK
jgi:hypothetical protein